MADKTLSDAAQRLQRMVNDDQLLKAIERVGLEMGLHAEDLTKRLMSTRLKPRTGRLRASVRNEVTRTGDRVEIRLLAGNVKLPCMATHEYGATIRPRRGKYLRIPLPPALTGAGVDRRAGGSLRNDPNFAFVPARNLKGRNPLLIHVRTGKPWYVLKRQVRIPPRPTVGPAFKKMQKDIVPELANVIRPVLEG